MVHQRQTIRQAIVAALVAAATDAGTRVYDTPNDERTAFPSLVILDGQETQQAVSLSRFSRTLERKYVVEVRAEVQQRTGYATQRDGLLAQVETALGNLLIAGVKAITPTHYMPDADHQGERPIVLGRQIFEVLYYTPSGDPTTTL